MAVFRFRFVLLAAVIGLALMLGAGSLAPRTASAAGVNIDPSSCGGVGNPNCTSLPADVTIGPNSCTVANSCDSLGDGVTIGSNSCNGTNACSFMGANSGSGSVGDGSCNGTNACYGSGANSGDSSIGDNSCDVSSACVANGSGGTGSVGDYSCNADSACTDNGFNGGSGAVGDGSCNGTQACFANGDFGTGRVGNNSCNASSSCLSNGDGGTGTVGDYSCNADSACYRNGHSGGTGRIGNISCNQSGTYDANCQNTHPDVGNCMYNDETPALCSEGSIQVNKVVAGDSSDRFNLKIDGIVRAYHVGNGGTTGPVLVDPGSHLVGESAVSQSHLSDYDSRVTCEVYNAIAGTPAHTLVPRTRGAGVFDVGVGDVVTCTITNTQLTSTFWHKTR